MTERKGEFGRNPLVRKESMVHHLRNTSEFAAENRIVVLNSHEKDVYKLLNLTRVFAAD